MTQETEAAGAEASAGGFFNAFLGRLAQVRPGEAPALGWAWLYIFSVLSSYYIMRPIRDQMGVAGGVNNLQWLFTGTLVGMLLLNVPYAYLVKTLPRTRFITITYRFFAANILLFAIALHFADSEQTIWIGRAFFIWISIFNLFVVSGVLGAYRGHLQFRARQAAVRFHRGRSNHWSDYRLDYHRNLRPARADTAAARRCDRLARSRGLQRAAFVAAVGDA